MRDADIDQLAATPKALAQVVAEAGDAELDAAPAGGWSARTILAHLRDDEVLCMRLALTRLLVEESPTISMLEGADWEQGRNRGRDRKEQLLGDFALQRQASISMLRALRDHEWARAGSAEGWGSFTIAQFLRAWAGHDAEHLAQVEAAIGETAEEARARRARPTE